MKYLTLIKVMIQILAKMMGLDEVMDPVLAVIVVQVEILIRVVTHQEDPMVIQKTQKNHQRILL